MRHRGLKSAQLQITNRKSQIPQRGYIMLTLMLALALMTIALLAVLPNIKQQINRDREEEMRHRGTSYMRAIQHFYKKFGRYPTRVEELENTNNLRFLRKRYTDPMNRDPATGKEKDFKLLHQQDITLNNGPVLGQPGQGGIGGQGPGGFGGQQGAFGGQQGGFGGAQGGLGGQQSAFGGQNGFGGAQGGFGGQTGAGQQANPGTSTGGDSSGGSGPGASGNSNSSASSPNSNGTSGSGLNGQTFGGGPILGVASTSKAKTIRVFFDKNHYNDWLFIYVPQADRGGLLTGPINPSMQTGNVGGLTPGQMAGGPQGQGGLGQGGFGQSGFGQGLTNGGPNQGPQPPSPQPPGQPPQQ
jgi:type II secretory pathway pseudopilin PulG